MVEGIVDPSLGRDVATAAARIEVSRSAMFGSSWTGPSMLVAWGCVHKPCPLAARVGGNPSTR
jgi:hypothetical protein